MFTDNNKKKNVTRNSAVMNTAAGSSTILEAITYLSRILF